MPKPAAVLTWAAVLATAALAMVAPRAGPVDTGRTRQFKYLMGTSIRVEVYGGTAGERQHAADQAFAAVADVDRRMSAYRGDSELTIVNRTAAIRPVVLSAPLFAVIEACETVATRSGGAFDATSGPLSAAWGVPAHSPRVPSRAELDAVRPVIGWRLVSLDAQAHTAAFARAGVALEIDPAVKGFAAESAAASLRQAGLAGVVDTGSAQFLVGRPTGKTAWSLGIADPSSPDRLLGAIDVVDGAVSTTATSRSQVPGLAVWRTPVLDPRTLQPSAASLSATVVSPDAAVSAALSRAAFVLGPQGGLALLDQFPDTWGLIAYADQAGHTAVSVTPARRHAFHPAP